MASDLHNPELEGHPHLVTGRAGLLQGSVPIKLTAKYVIPVGRLTPKRRRKAELYRPTSSPQTHQLMSETGSGERLGRSHQWTTLYMERKNRSGGKYYLLNINPFKNFFFRGLFCDIIFL